MDQERAETHLRRVAEAELRRAFAAEDGPAHTLDQLIRARQGIPTSRLAQVARALTAVGALDVEVANAIRDEFALAVAIRQGTRLDTAEIMRNPAVRRLLALRSQLATGGRGVGRRTGGAGRTATTGEAGTPGEATGVTEAGGVAERVVPLGMMIPVTSLVAHGEVYLLAYSHTGSSARITVVAHLRGESWGGTPAGVFSVDGAGATDDKGNPYLVSISGGGRDRGEWAGELTLEPEPPPDIRWLDIPVEDGDVHRIPLEPEHPLPKVEFTADAHSPGEHYLHGVAAQIFGELPVFTHRLRGQAPAFRPTLADHLTDGLGDIVVALQSAGALSPLSQVPAQLVTLCESLGITNHGIAAQPTLDLPDPWLSLLTHHHRRKQDTAPPGSGVTGAAVLLPEIDGVRLAVLGLHNGADGSIVHVHASGLAEGSESDLPLLWIRDESGRWHTTRRNITSRLSESELMTRLEIFPPLPRTACIEILAAGRSAQARTELPLQWI